MQLKCRPRPPTRRDSTCNPCHPGKKLAPLPVQYFGSENVRITKVAAHTSPGDWRPPLQEWAARHNACADRAANRANKACPADFFAAWNAYKLALQRSAQLVTELHAHFLRKAHRSLQSKPVPDQQAEYLPVPSRLATPCAPWQRPPGPLPLPATVSSRYGHGLASALKKCMVAGCPQWAELSVDFFNETHRNAFLVPFAFRQRVTWFRRALRHLLQEQGVRQLPLGATRRGTEDARHLPPAAAMPANLRVQAPSSALLRWLRG